MVERCAMNHFTRRACHRACEIPRTVAEKTTDGASAKHEVDRGTERRVQQEVSAGVLGIPSAPCALTLPRANVRFARQKGTTMQRTALACSASSSAHRPSSARRGLHAGLPVLRDRQGLPRQGVLRRAQVPAVPRLEGLPGGQSCNAGKCEAIPGYCRNKADCPADQECIANQCQACAATGLPRPAPLRKGRLQREEALQDGERLRAERGLRQGFCIAGDRRPRRRPTSARSSRSTSTSTSRR